MKFLISKWLESAELGIETLGISSNSLINLVTRRANHGPAHKIVLSAHRVQLLASGRKSLAIPSTTKWASVVSGTISILFYCGKFGIGNVSHE